MKLKEFKYTPANETMKPGYLQRRFAEIRKRQREEAEEEKLAADKRVLPIKKISVRGS